MQFCKAGLVARGFSFSFAMLALCSVSAFAAEPGRGATAELERNYLQFIIDHHFAGMRMTELAAGTERSVEDDISPNDGTHPTPGFEPTETRAQAVEIKSLARRNNRMQREEILKAQRFLRGWYGINYEPMLSSEMRADIERLEAASGPDFDRLFLGIFSHHHYDAVIRSIDCIAGRELRHEDLHQYCHGIVNSQLDDIDEMRKTACRRYEMCDLQPQDRP